MVHRADTLPKLPMPLSTATKLSNLSKIVFLHESFWNAAAPQSPQVAAWITREWEPWLTGWSAINWSSLQPDQASKLITEQGARLTALRERARAQGIPLPDLSDAHAQDRDAPQPTHPARPRPAPASPTPAPPRAAPRALSEIDQLVAELDRITNERFWAQTGYKPGQPLNRRDPEDAKMIPAWLTIRYQVAHEQAAEAAQPSQVSGSFDHTQGMENQLSNPFQSAAEDPLVADINETTWQRFWEQTGYKPGQYLDWSDPADKKMHWPWLKIRYEVVRQTALERGQRKSVVGLQSGDPWRVTQSSPPADLMRIPAPYYQTGFIGAEAPALAKRSGVLAQIAPVLAPATGGFTAKLELDDRQHLNASVCVDGKCYTTSMDIAPQIAAIMQKVAQEHRAMHAADQGGSPKPQTTTIAGERAVQAVDQAVSAAGDAMIDSLVDRHRAVICGSWIGDIGNALKGAGSAIYSGVTKTAQAFKGPITAVAVTAATAAGGPAAGAAAGELVGPLIDKAAGGKASPKLEAAVQAAQTDPTIAAALSAAQTAVAHTIAAYHVQATATQAAAGQPAAQQQIEHVAQAAEQGDPAAQQAAAIVHSSFASHIENRRLPSGERDHRGSGGGGGRHHHHRGTHRVPELGPDGMPTGQIVLWHHTPDQVKFSNRAPHFYQNGLFLFDDPSGQPIPAGTFQGQRVTGYTPSYVVQYAQNAQNVSASGEIVGDLPWYQVVGNEPNSDVVGDFPWLDIVGASADPHGSHAVRAANHLRSVATQHAAANAANAVGVVLTSAGTWVSVPFASLDDADDWFGVAKYDPSTFVYAAYFDKGGLTGPAIANEEFGHARPRTTRQPAATAA